MSRREAKPRVVALRIYLAKEGVTSFDNLLKDPNALESFPLSEELDFEGYAYIKVNRVKNPHWAGFVQQGLDYPLRRMPSSNHSAVVVLESEGRLFAATFGYGWNLLDMEMIEPSFGLKVVLNTIDHKKIRAVNSRNFDTITRQTQRQTSRGVGIENFGLDVRQDLLKALTGEPADPTFARRLTGADPIGIALKITFPELGTKCAQLLEKFKETTYKENFGWVDDLQPVRNPDLISDLDDALVERLNDGDLNQIHLAPPEILDWMEQGEFRYGHDPMTLPPRPEIDIHEYLESLGGLPVTADRLRGQVAMALGPDGITRKRWSIYKCLVAEVSIANHVYVLSLGEWFRVEQDFAAEVDSYLSTLNHNPNLIMPLATEGKSEGEYNEAAHDASGGVLALVDKKNVRLPGQTPVEPCDLFSNQRQFIHVKKGGKSSALSHLFLQATVSGELFQRVAKFREAMRERVPGSFKDHITVEEPDPRQFEVVFAIIQKANGPVALTLPFFSRVGLKQAAERLSALGYKVAIKHIGFETKSVSAPVTVGVKVTQKKASKTSSKKTGAK